MRRALAALLASSALAAGARGDDPAGFARALAELTDPEPLPVHHLAIEPKPLRRLLAFRDGLLESGPMSPLERLWVPAALVHNGHRYPARLRLRGDLGAHWRGETHSYRLKFKHELLDGRKEINLILPWDKHYGVEWLQTQLADELGLLFFPSRFVHLRINGSDAGLYLENEHPTREYLERMGRPASSIFTPAFYWTLYVERPASHAAFVLPGSRDLPPLKGIGQIKQRATWDPDRPDFAKKQLAYALEFYRLMTRASSDQIAERAGRYLDLDKFARYVAIQDFFGSRHALELNDNVRLYLDPTSGKLEFMPWDTSLRPLAQRLQGGVPPAELLEVDDEGFRALLSIPRVRTERERALRQLVAAGDRHRTALNRLHAELVRLYPDDARLRESVEGIDRRLAGNLELLRRHLARAGPAQVAARGAAP